MKVKAPHYDNCGNKKGCQHIQAHTEVAMLILCLNWPADKRPICFLTRIFYSIHKFGVWNWTIFQNCLGRDFRTKIPELDSKRKLSDVFVGNCKPGRSESVYVNTSEKPNIFVYTPAVCRDELTQNWVTICFIQPIQKKFQWTWSVLWSLNQWLV